MEPPLDPSSMFLLLVPLLISVNVIPTCLGAYDYRYTNCSSTTSSCGQSLAYPFWGGERANYCGLPDFQVLCEGDILTITIGSLKYRLLQLDSTSQILVVARDDYFDISSCPADYKNNSFDQTPFKYVDKGFANVTILYDCSTSSFPPQFPSNIINTPCKKADGSDIPVYYFAGSWYSSACTSVSMPIYEQNLGEVAADIQDVLRKGFELQYKVNNSKECNRCSQSGGQCGYEGGQFSCFCKDGPKKTSCSVSSCSSRFSLQFVSTMKPPFNPSSMFFLLAPLLISVNFIPTSLGAEVDRYTNCSSTTFSCGENIQNLTYPFWGGERPNYCGLPDFKLTCERNNIPIFTIHSIRYRVLHCLPTPQTLVVARDDYFETICPTDYKNNSFDETPFSYADGLRDVTFLYDCPTYTPFPSNTNDTDCERADGADVAVYYLPGSVYIEDCKSVIIPIYEGNLGLVSVSILAALKSGFGLQWRVSINEECNRCSQSNGQCGYDEGQFSCFCKDGPYKTSCPENRKGLIAGVSAAGAAAFLIFIGLGVIVARRRKRVAEQSQTKDLFMAPYSRGVTTSTTTSSQSVPSSVTSKAESLQHSFFYGVKVFTYAELEEATKNFDPSVELGDGGFGTVYYGILKDGRAVAVKRLYESNMKRVEQFRNEVEILARLKHKNLVELYGCTSRHSRELLLVYEYIANGTVSDHLHGDRSMSSLLPWRIRLNIAVETAEALAFLHVSDVIHRDVKTNNILLDHNFCVKVADFGLSRLFPNDVTHVSTAPQGTPGYVDPEYFQCYQVTNKSDVYSFGVVLIELISSLEAVDITRHRHHINLANLAINRIQNHQVHELVDPLLGFERDDALKKMTTAVAELAFRCLQQDGEMRPSMDEVLQILRGIQKEGYGGHEEVKKKNNMVDEIMLLKDAPPIFSPDSVADNNWVSSSTTSTSS